MDRQRRSSTARITVVRLPGASSRVSTACGWTPEEAFDSPDTHPSWTGRRGAAAPGWEASPMSIAEALRFLRVMRVDQRLFWDISLMHDRAARADAIRAAGFDCTLEEIAEVCANPYDDYGTVCDELV
jgi:hypothetical protein